MYAKQVPPEFMAVDGKEEEMENKKQFADLGLSEETLSAINKKGFEEPTDIQVLTIPLMLRDDINIIAQAQTGF